MHYAVGAVDSVAKAYLKAIEKDLGVKWYQNFSDDLDKVKTSDGLKTRKTIFGFKVKYLRRNLWRAMLWVLLTFYIIGACISYLVTFWVFLGMVAIVVIHLYRKKI